MGNLRRAEGSGVVSAILILIPLSIVIASAFLLAFVWAVRSGQYDDTCTPSMRVLLDDSSLPPPDPRRNLPMNPPLHPSQEGNLQPRLPTKLPSWEGPGVGSRPMSRPNHPRRSPINHSPNES